MNLDKNKLFPNQLLDGDPTECTALAVADVAGNILATVFDPDYTYAMTLFLEGKPATTLGSDPLTGMQSAVGYGLLPASLETTTALLQGQTYVANYLNYSLTQKSAALQYTLKGVKNLLGNGDDFDSIKRYLQGQQWGVVMSMTWFSSFTFPVNGILQAPSGTTSNHCVAVYDVQIIDGKEYLLFKPWLGQNYGLGGYGLMSRELCDTICSSAFGFNPNAIRWFSLVGIAITKYPFLKDYVSLLTAMTPEVNVQTDNGQKLYQVAKERLGYQIVQKDAANNWGMFGCAQTVNALAQLAWGHPVGGGLSTAAMWECLKDQTKYQSVLPADNLPGDIIISPTNGASTAKLKNGHVGICGKYGIVSNNSETGTLQENYTLQSWQAYFTDYGGLPTLVFRPL